MSVGTSEASQCVRQNEARLCRSRRVTTEGMSVGYNSVAVLFNDQLEAIRNDANTGERIANAMRGWHMRDRDRLATWFGYGQIVSQDHADYSQVVVCGQNGGRPLADCDKLDRYALDQLVSALVRHGYSVKAPRKAKPGRSG